MASAVVVTLFLCACVPILTSVEQRVQTVHTNKRAYVIPDACTAQNFGTPAHLRTFAFQDN